MRVQSHKAMTVVISDFSVEWPRTGETRHARTCALESWPGIVHVAADQSQTRLRGGANQRPHELELPALGRLVFQDAETGEMVESTPATRGNRDAFGSVRKSTQEQSRLFRSAGIDSIQLRTDNLTARRSENFLRTRETEVARMKTSRKNAKTQVNTNLCLAFAAARLRCRERHPRHQAAD